LAEKLYTNQMHPMFWSLGYLNCMWTHIWAVQIGNHTAACHNNLLCSVHIWFPSRSQHMSFRTLTLPRMTVWNWHFNYIHPNMGPHLW
jgi:hypothetical protein